MELQMRDLVIRLDEKRKRLQLLTPKDKRSLQCFFELAEDGASDHADIAQKVGAAVLAFLSANYPGDTFGIAKYRQAGRDFAQELDQEWRVLMASGDAEQEFDGARLRIDLFDDTWSITDIDNVTSALEQAASKGSQRAKDYLADEWPALGQVFRKRLSRRRD